MASLEKNLGLVGTKCGMTRVFTDAGDSIPVSVISVDPNRVVYIKTIDKDGYQALQLTTGKRRASRVTKPLAGHYAKANVEVGSDLWEVRLDGAELPGEIQPGHVFSVELFKPGQIVDVTGTSKGKGFAGVVKRHNFATQDATHGNSLSHRAHGSTGQNQTPGRVFKGKKMAGQMGNKRVTTQNLEVVSVDADRNLLLIKGAIPGATGGLVMVKPAVKREYQEGQ
jgi:large subunit ribosomal protein L3